MIFESDSSLGQQTLVDRVKHNMNDLGYQQLQRVECSAVDSTIHLTGKLNSYYLKQIAQTAAIKVSGVNHVVNDIEVNV